MHFARNSKHALQFSVIFGKYIFCVSFAAQKPILLQSNAWCILKHNFASANEIPPRCRKCASQYTQTIKAPMVFEKQLIKRNSNSLYLSIYITLIFVLFSCCFSHYLEQYFEYFRLSKNTLNQMTLNMRCKPRKAYTRREQMKWCDEMYLRVLLNKFSMATEPFDILQKKKRKCNLGKSTAQMQTNVRKKRYLH